MKFTTLGHSGLKVSKVCFGCMSIGDKNPYFEWVVPEAEAHTLIRSALELGVNFFDTANVYSFGSSERQLGEALKKFAVRDEVVIATKAYFGSSQGPNTNGLSRKVLIQECEASLQRLGTDYIDLYQIHRWDDETPIEETMEALHTLITQGKVRYIGASSMAAWQFQRAQHVAEKNGWTKFISMQCQVNLLYREEEREMLPLCDDIGVGCIPWSPLARGRITRDWGTTSTRSEADRFGKLYEEMVGAVAGGILMEQDRKIVEEVTQIAEERGVSRAQIGLAWLHSKSMIAAPIVGVGKALHLEDAVAAVEIHLTPEEIERLEKHYLPHPYIIGGDRQTDDFKLTVKPATEKS